MKISGQKTIVAACAMSLVLLLPAPPAAADCVDGLRKSSAEEQAAVKRTASIAPQVFSAPDGYQKSNEEIPKAYAETCNSSGGDHVSGRYQAVFLRVDNIEEKQARMKAMQEKMMKQMQAGGDPTEIAKQMQAEVMSSGVDDSAAVEIKLNVASLSFKGKKIKLPGVRVPAYQQPTNPGSARLRTVVLFGAFGAPTKGEIKGKLSSKAPPQRIQNLLLTIEGTKAATRALLAKAKLGLLAKLVKR